MNSFVYVVTYDHPSYEQGVEGVFRKRRHAKKAIKFAFRQEFGPGKWYVKSLQGDIIVYTGVDKAEGVFYYIYKRELRG